MATPEFLAHLKVLCTDLTARKPLGLCCRRSLVHRQQPSRSYSTHIPVRLSLLPEDIDRQLLVRRMKGALFKSGILCGYPKVGNFVPLASGSLEHQCHRRCPPEDLRENKPLRFARILNGRMGTQPAPSSTMQALFDNVPRSRQIPENPC